MNPSPGIAEARSGTPDRPVERPTHGWARRLTRRRSWNRSARSSTGQLAAPVS